MAIINESLDTVNSMRASLGLPPIQQTLDGATAAAQIVQNYTNPPQGTVSYYNPPSTYPTVYVPPVVNQAPSSSASAAMYSQTNATGATTTNSGIPYVQAINQFLKDHNIALTKTQAKALEYAGAGIALGTAAYTAYEALKPMKHKVARRKSLAHRKKRHKRRGG